MAIDTVGAILKQQKRPHVKIAVNPYSIGKVGINIDNNAMHEKSRLARDPSFFFRLTVDALIFVFKAGLPEPTSTVIKPGDREDNRW